MPPVTLIPVVLVLLHAVGLAFAVDAVMKVRTAQGTVAWIIALILIPYIAIPLYLVFGRRKFFGYARARRRGLTEIDEVAKTLVDNLRPFVPDFDPSNQTRIALMKLARLPATRGNRVDLLVDGEKTFDAILSAIDDARDYILFQYYILRDDTLGKRVHDALTRARARGVRIHLLYDELGSMGLPAIYLATLVDAGAECSPFRADLGRRQPFRINFRNHRKVVVVDGRLAFVGGLNVGDEYLGLHEKLKPWRDTHVAIRGPAVQCVQLAFVEDWYWVHGRVPKLEWSPRPDETSDAVALVIPSSPADDLETCSLLYSQVAASARTRLWLASPYFVPDRALVGSLQLAALRGVDVRVIVPEISDAEMLRLSAFTFYDEVIPSGVKLFRFQAGFLHQKVALADSLVLVGSANLDNRSFRINFEITILVDHEPFAQQVSEMLKADLSKSVPVAKDDFQSRTFWFRFKCRVARLMAPIQ